MSVGRKIAVVGWAYTSRDQAPYNDLDWEIWGINEASRFKWFKRCDCWFQIHPEFIFSRERNPIDPNHYKWLQSVPGPGQEGHIPVVMQQTYPDIPASTAYPLEEILSFLGRPEVYSKLSAKEPTRGAGFPLTSSVSLMFALALYQGAQEIGFWGVEMATNTEWRYQREGFCWLAGFAEARGVRLTFPPDCSLLKGKVYGWEALPMIGRQELELYYNRLKRDEADALAQMNCRIGAFEDLSEIAKQLEEKHQAVPEEMAKRLSELKQELKAHEGIMNQVVGGRMVVTDLIHRIDMQEQVGEKNRVGQAYLGGEPIEDPVLRRLQVDPRANDFGEARDEPQE